MAPPSRVTSLYGQTAAVYVVALAARPSLVPPAPQRPRLTRPTGPSGASGGAATDAPTIRALSPCRASCAAPVPSRSSTAGGVTVARVLPPSLASAWCGTYTASDWRRCGHSSAASAAVVDPRVGRVRDGRTGLGGNGLSAAWSSKGGWKSSGKVGGVGWGGNKKGCSESAPPRCENSAQPQSGSARELPTGGGGARRASGQRTRDAWRPTSADGVITTTRLAAPPG